MKTHTNLFKKAWLPLALLAVCLLLTLTACNTDGQENSTTAPTGGGTQAPTEEATKPDYNPDTQVFETFKDMQDNVALYKDQLPCVRSTKGYREVGKGAATYRLTKDKPQGTFIRVADGVFAQLSVTEGMTTVSPEQFGAYGNGETDDTVNLIRAIDFAVENNLTLHLTGDYRTAKTIAFDKLNVQSDNARISYYGKEFNQPAVDMYENVNIYGKINIYADHYSPAGTHGGRCGMSFGNYDTGRGAKNCYVEHIVIWSGGFAGADAILLTGDSSNITFGTIEVPEGHNKVNCVMMMHWGNYGEHHPADLLKPSTTKYVHEDGAGPTKHPHDIKIGLIDSHADHTALYISACYNVTVDEVRQYGGKSAVRMVAGDVGFKYAVAAEKAHGAKNIYVKKVTGTDLSEIGLYIDGVNGYENDQHVHYQVKIDEATLSGTDTSTHGICFYGIDDLQIGKLSIKKFEKRVMQLGYANESIKIGEVLIEDCPAQIMTGANLSWSRFDYTETRTATRGVEIDKMTVKNSGLSNRVLAALLNIEGLHIKELNVEKLTCTSLFAVYNTTKNIKIDQMNLTTPRNTPISIMFAQDLISSDSNISVTIHGAANIPATSGQSCAATITKN